MEERICFTSPGTADASAPAGLQGAASWNGRNKQKNPGLMDELYQKVWSWGSSRQAGGAVLRCGAAVQLKFGAALKEQRGWDGTSLAPSRAER